jgi:hypothetical protein
MPKQLCIPAIAISFSTFGSVIGHAAPSCCCRLIQLSLPATCWLYLVNPPTLESAKLSQTA